MAVRASLRAVALGVVGTVLVAGCGSDTDGTTGPSTTATTVPAGTSTTTTAPTSTTDAATTTLRGVPPAVTVLSARPGGGSGEVAVNWEAVAGATGYRVARSTATSGPFTVAVDLNLATGEVTASESAGNLWSPGSASFFPTFTYELGDLPPDDFEYVDLGGGDPRYFRVVAYNAMGESVPSVVVCAVAPGGVDPC
jgi:hypothetical protein